MKEPQPERLDSDVIRQGLLSIRNSQIQLLNQLKTETQQLRKSPIRFGTSTDDSRTDSSKKHDDIFSYPPQNVNSQVRYNPPPSPPTNVQKPFSFGLAVEKQLQSQNTYLKDENKMLNETIQKFLYSRSLDKQRIRELQSYLYFSQKMHIQLINQLLNGIKPAQVKKNLLNDLQTNKDVYTKYQQSNHKLILQILQQKQIDQTHSRVSSNPDVQKDRQIANQLGQLKDQLAILMKSNHQKNQKPNIQIQLGRFKEQEDIFRKKSEEFQKRIAQLESDNKELAACWQRQINQRKAIINELQRTRKDAGSIEDKEKQRQRQIANIQSQFQTKLTNIQKIIKAKEAAQVLSNDNTKRLSDTIGLLKEENERLKRQIKSIDEIRMVLQKQDQHAIRQLQNDMRSKIMQQGIMLRNYQKQIFDLRNHLLQVKKNHEIMAQMHIKQKQNQQINQQIYLKKVQTIKTNSTVEHLWQVKKVEFDNINELLQQLRDKNKRI